jgi:hypothetical protein
MIIFSKQIIGIICITIMKIQSYFRICVLIVGAIDALAPTGIHLEVTILAHTNSLKIIDIFTLSSVKYAIFVNNNKTIAEEKNIYNYTIYIAV